jgi:hypothetical protein
MPSVEQQGLVTTMVVMRGSTIQLLIGQNPEDLWVHKIEQCSTCSIDVLGHSATETHVLESTARNHNHLRLYGPHCAEEKLRASLPTKISTTLVLASPGYTSAHVRPQNTRCD